MDAYQEAIEVIRTLLKSAVPHPVEHPTLTAAWTAARAFLHKQGIEENVTEGASPDEQVTLAVLLAEGALKDAIFRFEKLLEAEKAILNDPDTQPVYREIATHGVANAERTLGLIRKAWAEA